MKKLFVFLFFSVSVFAQVSNDSLRGYWIENEGLNYTYNVFNPSTKEIDVFNLSANELRNIRNNIRVVTDIFKSNKALNPPMGTAVYFYGQGGQWLELSNKNSPRPFNFSLLERRLFKNCDTCRTSLASEAYPLLTITVNDLTSLLRIAPYKNDINKDPIALPERWFIAPTLQERFKDFPAEFTEEVDFILLSKINKPIGIPVTQEEFLKEAIRVTKKDYLEIQKKLSESTYETGKKELDDISKDMEKAIRDMERIDPNTARNMRQEFEKQKRETLENLRAGEKDNTKTKQEGISNTKFILDSLEKELETLTSEERLAPALYKFWGYAEDDSTNQKILSLNQNRNERISGLVDRGGFPVIKINPNYFSAAINKTDAQLIVLKILREYRTLRPSEFLSNLVEKIYNNLNLLSIFELLN